MNHRAKILCLLWSVNFKSKELIRIVAHLTQKVGREQTWSISLELLIIGILVHGIYQ